MRIDAAIVHNFLYRRTQAELFHRIPIPTFGTFTEPLRTVIPTFLTDKIYCWFLSHKPIILSGRRKEKLAVTHWFFKEYRADEDTVLTLVMIRNSKVNFLTFCV